MSWRRCFASWTGRACLSSEPSGLPAKTCFPAPSGRCMRSGIQPASVLEPRALDDSDLAKPKRPVQADRGRMLRAAADHRDHLAEAAFLANSYQLAEQHPADPAAPRCRVEIDAVLHRIAVGGPRPVGPGIGVAENGGVRAPPPDADISGTPARASGASSPRRREDRSRRKPCRAGPPLRRWRRRPGCRFPRWGAEGRLAASTVA